MSFLPLKPIPMKERVSMIFVWYGRIDVKDGAFVVIDKNGVRKMDERRFGEPAPA